MLSSNGLSRKYEVGKMAEIMIACNEMIFKLQEEVYNVSLDVVAMGGVPAVCTSSSTCFGNHLSIISEKTPINRTTSLPTPPEPNIIQDRSLKKLYQKLMDLEDVGRYWKSNFCTIKQSEWLKVFMYMNNYMRVLKPMARGEWDDPQKFLKCQTLTLNGPYPGISSELIIANDKPSHVSRYGKVGEKISVSTDFVSLRPLINIQNMELEDLGNDGREFSVTACPGPRKSSKSDSRVLCDCLKTAQRSSRSSETQGKQLVGKIRPKYMKKYDYCVEIK